MHSTPFLIMFITSNVHLESYSVMVVCPILRVDMSWLIVATEQGTYVRLNCFLGCSACVLTLTSSGQFINIKCTNILFVPVLNCIDPIFCLHTNTSSITLKPTTTSLVWLLSDKQGRAQRRPLMSDSFKMLMTSTPVVSVYRIGS